MKEPNSDYRQNEFRRGGPMSGATHRVAPLFFADFAGA
jgi:hypothetical protein